MSVLQRRASHPQDVLHVADDADDAEGHEEGKGGGCYQAGVLYHPEQETGLHVEGEERCVGRRGKEERHGDGTAEDAHDEGGYHR